MTIDQISVFVENRYGALSQITEELAAAGINMRALSIAETHDFGVLRFIANETGKAADVLREAGHIVSVNPVLAVIVRDEPGGFAKAVKALAAAEIDLEYAYAFLTPQPDTACMIFRVADNDAAAQVLEAEGIRLATKEELV